ncbi:MAG: gamma subclass chorismate mutase AroQ [Collimonas sp.]|uniref:gamma subclass chorismate mutase AroQ n=1 Tax=Collimonas sp. TaxID=1963772 RepID=UPI0032658109
MKIINEFANKQFFGKFLSGLSLLFLLAACQNLTPAPDPADAAEVDHLLQLIDQRLDVAPMVAKAKWDSGGAINDPPREQLILDTLTTQASGLDAVFVRRFFQAQFDASKALQLSLHAQWRQQDAGKFSDAPDLGRDVRPVLDQLTPQLIASLRHMQPLLAAPGMRAYIETRARALVRGDVDGLPRRMAVAGLFAN